MSSSSMGAVIDYSKNRLEDISLESNISSESLYKIIHLMLPDWKRRFQPKQFWGQNICDLFEIETSSVSPVLIAKDALSLTDVNVVTEETIMSAMVRNNLSVKLSPIKEFKIEGRITNIEKGTPPVID